jgi:DNA-binding winged helix-turn-helix (wHTH) protein
VAGSRYCNAGGADRPATEASLEFGRFRVLLRRRLLVADGVPVALGTRAFELLLALLEADGRLVSKEQLQARVWPGIAVEEGNLKAQVSLLRRVFGEDRDFIRTEHGRGYRLTAAIRSNSGPDGLQHPPQFRSWSSRRLFRQRRAWRASGGWSFDDRLAGHFDPLRGAGVSFWTE